MTHNFGYITKLTNKNFEDVHPTVTVLDMNFYFYFFLIKHPCMFPILGESS
jgi:hypothetical protein